MGLTNGYAMVSLDAYNALISKSAKLDAVERIIKESEYLFKEDVARIIGCDLPGKNESEE